jgi:hypothetical protein
MTGIIIIKNCSKTYKEEGILASPDFALKVVRLVFVKH